MNGHGREEKQGEEGPLYRCRAAPWEITHSISVRIEGDKKGQCLNLSIACLTYPIILEAVLGAKVTLQPQFQTGRAPQ